MEGLDTNNSVDLKEFFTLQISEVEMLTSMYPNQSEFQITLPSVLADMNRYIDGKTLCIPNELDFILNLEIPDIKEKLEVDVNYPHDYPERKPFVCCRANTLSREQQKELNFAVKNYIDDLHKNELCIITVTSWLTDNAGSYFAQKSTLKTSTTEIQSTYKDVLCRMWIYSHHIYNKFKRREIMDIADDFKLTGFSLPGKPGFICIEGWKNDCNAFLQNLKQMSWKKISLVKEEINSDDLSLTDFKKFDKFQEISFQVRRGPAKEYHMDMGQFLKYLENHDCAYAFNDLFGLEGHISIEK